MIDGKEMLSLPYLSDADNIATIFLAMNILGEEPSTAETTQRQVSFLKVCDYLFFAEPILVSIAASFVYISIILDWASFAPWLFLAFAFSPFLLRIIRYHRPSKLTPFDIPIVVLLGGIIVGMVVSDFLDTSLGVFQNFLAGTAFYYSLANYHKPLLLVKTGLSLALLGAIIALAFALKWSYQDVSIPHGLEEALAIIGIIVLGITIFARRNIYRWIGAIFGLTLLGAVILFADESLQRLITLESIEGRLRQWIVVIHPIEDSQIWTGLGLGCWPLSINQESIYFGFGHVHNAYLELYINTGIFGMFALICFLAVGAKLAADILYSSRNSPYYGFGVGVVLASMAVLAVSFMESAAFGFGLISSDRYYYILSPIPFILAGALVIARQLLREHSVENIESA